MITLNKLQEIWQNPNVFPVVDAGQKIKLPEHTRSIVNQLYSTTQIGRTFEEVNSVEKVVQLVNQPSFAVLRNSFGSKYIESILKLHLISLNQRMQLKRSLTETQISETAYEIISQFAVLNMADLNLVFRRIVTGYYGEMYESISTTKIMSFFRSYFNERLEVAETLTLRKHQQYHVESNRSQRDREEKIREENKKNHEARLMSLNIGKQK